jgi:peroxiredoxin
MNRLKSIFISVWNTLLMVGIIRSVYQLNNSIEVNAWVLALIALATPVLFFVWVFTFNVTRTSRAMKAVIGISSSAFVTAVLTANTTSESLAWLAVSLVGAALYEWWYSSFGVRDTSFLAIGSALPAMDFETADGSIVKTQDINKPMLLMFFRGNWCPLCMAQIKEIAAQYQQLADKGVEVILISPQSHSNTQSLAQRFEVPMTFLIDKNNRMADLLGIKAENGLPTGLEVLGYDSDTVMPTVIITDANNNIIYADLTNDYRIRPEPDAFLEVLQTAGI